MPMVINFNPGQLEAQILNISDRAAKGASESMRKSAIRIRDLAKDYAPIKTGTLENSIDYAAVKGAKNRNVFIVYIDLDKANPGSAGHEVGDYAWIMEQQLRPYGNKGKALYLGPGSQMKAASGLKVGGYFLSRAVRDGGKDIFGDALAAVRRVTGGGSVNVAYQRGNGEE